MMRVKHVTSPERMIGLLLILWSSKGLMTYEELNALLSFTNDKLFNTIREGKYYR